jgi:hypothetical protein
VAAVAATFLSFAHVVLDISVDVNATDGVGRPPVPTLPLRLEGSPPSQIQGAQRQIQAHGRHGGDGVVGRVQTSPGVGGAVPNCNGGALQPGHEGVAPGHEERLRAGVVFQHRGFTVTSWNTQ